MCVEGVCVEGRGVCGGCVCVWRVGGVWRVGVCVEGGDISMCVVNFQSIFHISTHTHTHTHHNTHRIMMVTLQR